MIEKDLYKILEVTEHATEDEIKKSFRSLATIHHPDKNNGSLNSEEKFKQIVYAYEILSDKVKREKYNSQRRFKIKPTENTDFKKHSKYNQKTKPVYSNNKNYFWAIIVAIILIYYFYNSNNITTTGNSKADIELENQPENRPNSGEIEFK